MSGTPPIAERAIALASRAASWPPEVARERANEDFQRAIDPKQSRFERECTAADMLVCAQANPTYRTAVAEKVSALQAVAQTPTVLRDDGNGLRVTQRAPLQGLER